MSMKTWSDRTPLIIFSAICFTLLSPKWTFPVAAWLAPAMLILLTNPLKPWKSYLLSVVILLLSSLIAQYKVMPFPGIIFFVMILIVSLIAAVPFWLHRIIYSHLTGWKRTLLFPSLLVTYEYITSFGGGGTWGSMAYTQFPNFLLMQTASITGIWGITFLVGWFNSILFVLIAEHWNWQRVRKPASLFSVILICLLFYGLVKTNPYFGHTREMVRVAGITASNIEPIMAMYIDAFGKTLDIHEENLSQTSSELAELNKGLALFVEDPFDQRFEKTRSVLTASLDTLFLRSQNEAAAGAKIISWSEALTFVIKSEEKLTIKKGREFALRNEVYFLMTMASITPGKIEQGKKFIENKAILFGPSGEILNTFLKNRPVPVVEPSVAGDGNVPAIRTTYGNLAVSICYDADFPVLMQQLGQKGADILLLPSGDWKEIAPYHAQMAVVRAIENGVSLLRPVSNAQSVAVDFNGGVISVSNYFDKGGRVVVANLPVKGIPTFYTIIGDSVAWICIGASVILVLIAIRKKSWGVDLGQSTSSQRIEKK